MKPDFDGFYREQYGERWDSLKAAMLSEEEDKTSIDGLVVPYYMDRTSIETAMLLPVESASSVLDMCAAPGGKSTLALAALPAGSLAVCNEVVRPRTHILAENLIKWGYDNTIVTRNSAADFGKLTHYFDVILVDAPCSGEGMFRKDPQAIAEWSPAQVGLCADRQREILTDVWDALRPGGLLIYSTCTYNREENEDIVHFLCERFGATPLDASPSEAWHIRPSLDTDLPAYRFMPHYTRGEGLFMAVLRKPGYEEECQRDEWLPRTSRKGGKSKNPRQPGKGNPASWRTWLAAPDDYTFDIGDTTVTALPSAYATDHAFFATHFEVVHRGIPVASLKGRDWQPHHALALSTGLAPDAFEPLPLSLVDAITYLRREAPAVVPDSHHRGTRLVVYEGSPLGWCNHLGNRINNLYPTEWRIRSGYLPDDLRLPTW